MSTFPGRCEWHELIPDGTPRIDQSHESTSVQIGEPISLLGLLTEKERDYRSIGYPKPAASPPSFNPSWVTPSWKLIHGVPLSVNFPSCVLWHLPQALAAGRRQEVVISGLPSRSPAILHQGDSVINSSIAITVTPATSILFCPLTCHTFQAEVIYSKIGWSCSAWIKKKKKKPSSSGSYSPTQRNKLLILIRQCGSISETLISESWTHVHAYMYDVHTHTTPYVIWFKSHCILEKSE